MRGFLVKLWNFLKEIVMFGVEAFFVVASREVARRFLNRLRQRDALVLMDPRAIPATATATATASSSTGSYRTSSPSYSSRPERIPFLDEYQD